MVQRIGVQEVKRRMDAGEPIYFLDVREPHEHEYCRIVDGPLIPLSELARRTDDIDASPEALVVVYCHHGIRSLRGAAILNAAGFSNAVSLDGGIDAWSRHIDTSVPRY